MKSGKIVLFGLVLLAAALLIVVPEICKHSDATSTAEDVLLKPEEIARKIGELRDNSWQKGSYVTIRYSIDINEKDGNITGEQAENYVEELDAAYILTLNNATREFFLKDASYDFMELFRELNNFRGKSVTRSQVDTSFRAISGYMSLLGHRDKVSEFVKKQFDDGRAKQLGSSIENCVRSSEWLIKSKRVNAEKNELMGRIDKFRTAAFLFSNYPAERNCDSLYPGYEWYLDSCRRRR